MKKKAVKCMLLVIFIVLVILAIYNAYKWKVCGNQSITINTSNNAYTNSDLYVSIIAEKNRLELDSKVKFKFLDSNGKEVKNTEISYDNNSAIINIPEIPTGTYYLEAKVSSEAGKDTIQKEIYVSDGKRENISITLDKGIYKPGDVVNFSALLTSKDDDKPITKDTNISIYDGNDNRVYNENTKASDFGVVSGSFLLANEVNSGIYKLVVKTKSSETTKQFKVNPYIIPKYEVKVNYDKENYLVGDTAKITLNAKYFFGEPVSNAKFNVYINNESVIECVADATGVANIDYKIKDAKSYSVKVEAIDTSNYFVEETSSFVASTDIFEIELLPEYGSLIAGNKNDVYIFTKNADGTPVKTYVTISAEDYTKQVATDENGIGKFSIDIDELGISSYYYISNQDKSFKILAEDMIGNKVNKDIGLKVESKNLLLSTDKAKYEQGEDIKVKVNSLTDNTKTIYFFKNDKLVKIISTDLGEAVVNLDDTYGLIDVYVTEKNSNLYYYSSASYKRTIFIKPKKELNINISTNKDEYKPSEDISILFNTTDEKAVAIDTNLLVSMLDNSILSLAENDLSIDNIKLALADIKFSDDLDAASLYACIIDDAKEQSLMALLLKQSDRDINVAEETIRNYEQESKAAMFTIILVIVIILVVISFLSIKFTKFRLFIENLINFIILNFIIVLFSNLVINEYWWRYIDYSTGIFVVTTILVLAGYLKFISKYSSKIFRTSISIIITGLVALVVSFVVYEFDVSVIIILGILATLILIFVITSKIIEFKKFKLNKVTKIIFKEIKYIFKYVCAFIISFILGIIIEKVMKVFDVSVPITLGFVYLFNSLFNKKSLVESEMNINNSSRGIVAAIVIIIFAGIGVVSVISLIGNFADNSINDVSMQLNSLDSLNEFDTAIENDISLEQFNSKDTSGASNSSGILNNFFGNSKEETIVNIPTADKDNSQEVEASIDGNIRDVFLESMCFIPELISKDGEAKLDLQLSDNITTWTIQTIGNTKDGRVGYGIYDNVKVFKEFFVDFELPKNLVENDKISIPVTIYNYTDRELSVNLIVKEEDWFSLESNNITLNISGNNQALVYIPINVLKFGENKFRVEVKSDSLVDIVEKSANVSPKGYRVQKVVSTGNLDEDILEDILVLENIVEGTANVKVKIYSSAISQTIEGIENIFRMPTGCFEQISSSLYPNILALKYLEEHNIVDDKIKEKANHYISSGYQKLLTYEVKGEKGGYSLYGDSPAETVLTAYGLMEISDLSKVYEVDKKVIENMTDFLYKKQKANGAFTITGYHIGGADTRETLALNAYITWALSESNPNDERLEKSVKYLKDKLEDIDDNYTLALIANVLANTNDKELNRVLKRLVNNVKVNDRVCYITSDIIDYYGSRCDMQTIQTVALTSMALSKASYNPSVNKSLVNYLISQKDIYGTWYSTQATILALRAINEIDEKSKLENQTIKVKLNSNEHEIKIKDNPLEFYEVSFYDISKENKLSIDVDKGNAYYEVVEEYYIPYEDVDKKNDKIEISVETNNNLNVNEILKANIKAINRSEDLISNGMVTIFIPQGFVVDENSLMLLQTKGIIEKYEMSYTEINIYLRDFEASQIVNMDIDFRASYPVEITGLAVRAYDYYNPDVEGRHLPIEIKVK